LSKTQFNVILPSISRPATWSLLLRPSEKIYIYIFLFLQTIYRIHSAPLILINLITFKYQKTIENYKAIN
jgi:hypothetical protein